MTVKILNKVFKDYFIVGLIALILALITGYFFPSVNLYRCVLFWGGMNIGGYLFYSEVKKELNKQ